MKHLIGTIAAILGLLVLRYRGRDITPGLRWILFGMTWTTAAVFFFGQIPWVIDVFLILISILALALLGISMRGGGVGVGGMTIDRKRSPVYFWFAGPCMVLLMISYIVEGVVGLYHDLR